MHHFYFSVDHSFSMGIGVHSKGVRVEELELATKLVQDLITKDDIVIFSKTYCPYCKIAKDVSKQLKIFWISSNFFSYLLQHKNQLLIFKLKKYVF